MTNTTREQLMKKVNSYVKMNELITSMIKICHKRAENGHAGEVFRHDQNILEENHKDMLTNILREKHKLSAVSLVEGDNWFIEVHWD